MTSGGFLPLSAVKAGTTASVHRFTTGKECGGSCSWVTFPSLTPLRDDFLPALRSLQVSSPIGFVLGGHGFLGTTG